MANIVVADWADEKSVKINGNAFIYFLSGFTAVEAPLKQTGKGTGTTSLPPGIMGTVSFIGREGAGWS